MLNGPGREELSHDLQPCWRNSHVCLVFVSQLALKMLVVMPMVQMMLYRERAVLIRKPPKVAISGGFDA